jgi:hypothetical protein
MPALQPDFGPPFADAAADFLVRKFLLNEQQRKRLELIEQKKRVAAFKRRELRKAEITAAARQLKKTDVYVWGITGEYVVKQRHKIARQEYKEAYADFLEEYQDEIKAQSTYITNRFPWYKYDEELQTAIRRKVVSELWREHQDEFYERPEHTFSEFESNLRGLVE